MFDYTGSELIVIVIVLLSYVAFRNFFEHFQKEDPPRVERLDPAKATNEKTQEVGNPIGMKSIIPTAPIRRSSSSFIADIRSKVESYRDDPLSLVESITSMCLKNYDAASAMYFSAKAARILTADVANKAMFLSLCSSCIRVGSPHFVFKYFNEMDELSVYRDLDFFDSILKILTFKREFKTALSINDQYLAVLGGRVRGASEESISYAKSIYSCLLFSSVETKEYWRALKFFRQIEKTGHSPTDKDFLNIFRSLLVREDYGTISSTTYCLSENCQRAIHSALSQLVEKTREDVITLILNDNRVPVHIVEIIATTSSVLRVPGKYWFPTVISCPQLQESTIGLLLRALPKLRLDDLCIMDCIHRICNHGGDKAITLMEDLISKIHDESVLIGEVFPVLKDCIMRSLKVTHGSFVSLARSCKTIQSILDVHGVYSMGVSHGTTEYSCTVTEGLLKSLFHLPEAIENWHHAKSIVGESLRDPKSLPFPILSVLVEILLKCARAPEADGSLYFNECMRLFAERSDSKRLIIRPIETAIELKRTVWVNRFFSALISNRDDIDGQTISRLLNHAQSRDMGSFYLLLELVLMNRLPLSPKNLDKVRNNSRVHQILKKYKYKLTKQASVSIV